MADYVKTTATDYTIYKSGSTYYAVPSSELGLLTYSGSVFHTVVNNAINALHGSTRASGKLFIKAAAYDQTGPIIMQSNITLEASPAAVMTLHAGANCHMIQGNNNGGVQLDTNSNFAIIGGVWDGNKANQGGSHNDFCGISFEAAAAGNVHNGLIENLIIHDAGYCNINFYMAKCITIDHVESYNGDQACIMMNSADDCLVTHCYCHDSLTKGGIYFYTDESPSVTVESICNNIISNNLIINVNNSGISISVRKPGDSGNNNVIADNVCIDCGCTRLGAGSHPAINIGWESDAKALYCTVTGNTVYTTLTLDPSQGFNMQCDHSVISDNSISNLQFDAILLVGDHNTLTGNNIYNVTSGSHFGILINDGTYNTVANNSLATIGNTAIYCYKNATGSSFNHIHHNKIFNMGNTALRVDAGNNYNIFEDNYMSGTNIGYLDNGTGTLKRRNIKNVSGVNKPDYGSGTLQFTAAATLAVTHGLNTTPTKVTVTGSNADTSALWITSIGATTFTVNRGNSTGTPWIYWTAEV